MKYWWVNQNKTSAYEISGEFMWSPKRKTNGAFNQFYFNMSQVESGDVVFSFFKQKIQYVGRIGSAALSIPKPKEFWKNSWDNDGWFVPVTWFKVEEPFKPRDLIDQLRPFFQAKYAPLQRETGSGLEGVYLAQIAEGAAKILIQAGGPSAAAAVSASVEPVDTRTIIDRDVKAIEDSIDLDPSLSATEKIALKNARLGHGKFRRALEKVEAACRVTGVADPRLLIASHIRPWSLCETSHERLDGHNGLLLAPHVDHLFDRGLMTFEDNGDVRFSKSLTESDRSALGISSWKLNVGLFSDKQKHFLAFHRDIFDRQMH